MVFLVHVLADLFGVLAHACALEVRPVSSMYRNKLREIGSGSAMVFLVHVCADLFRVLAHACAWEVIQKQTERDGSVALLRFSWYMSVLIYLEH